jgi:hypothetical protein
VPGVGGQMVSGRFCWKINAFLGTERWIRRVKALLIPVHFVWDFETILRLLEYCTFRPCFFIVTHCNLPKPYRWTSFSSVLIQTYNPLFSASIRSVVLLALISSWLLLQSTVVFFIFVW